LNLTLNICEEDDAGGEALRKKFLDLMMKRCDTFCRFNKTTAVLNDFAVLPKKNCRFAVLTDLPF
jgi:hypothetical protein